MEIILLTDYRGFLRQGAKQYLPINKDILTKEFLNQGFKITEFNYEEIAAKKSLIQGKYIIYTSSQDIEYKKYIDDILYDLSKDNKLVPNYDIFKAHENKGYQEILKKRLNIESLDYFYFGNKKGLEAHLKYINKYPLILKKVNGAGSHGVYKVNNQKDLIKSIKKLNKPRNYFQKIMKQNIKKYFFRRKFDAKVYQDDEFMGQFVLQEFVKGLDSDWKVLIFGKKYYVLNRQVRENDFRASGSGKLSFIYPPLEVLNYAETIYEKFKVPFISLDIAFDGHNCYLIEFQGTHFGPYTIQNSNFYFIKEDNKWIYKNTTSDYDKEYSHSLIKYIKIDSNN